MALVLKFLSFFLHMERDPPTPALAAVAIVKKFSTNVIYTHSM